MMSYHGIETNGRNVEQPAAAGALALARQPSIYSLTFDELQNSMGGIGKDFGSMNMDEFLKNIWTAEESQAMAAALGAPEGGSAGLQRQGSLTMLRTLSQKTVEEVWRDLMFDSAGSAGESDLQQQQRQPTLGEMTLEEFLVRAGGVREEINPTISRPMANNSNNNSVYYGDLSAFGNSESEAALGFPPVGRSNVGAMPSSIPCNSGANLSMSSAGVRPYSSHLPLGANVDLAGQQGMRGGGIFPGMAGLGTVGVTVAAAGFPANQITSDGLSKGNGELSSLSAVPYMFGGGLRGRKSNGAVEKVVERRQKRMIKNRESAARSRARKQAYTMELEAEVAQLKEQNQELENKQAEVMEIQKNKILELLKQQQGTKKLCLRRTNTGPW